jgi:hypothetical protein
MRSILYPSIADKKRFKKEKFDRPSSIPEKLDRVKFALLCQARRGRSLFLYGILMELIEKEKLLIIKNKENKCINKADIPYFFYLMKERLYNAFYREEPTIDKEKFLICKYNLYNRSINE